MTTLEDLYYGNIVPHEHSFKRGSAYSEVLSYVIRHQDSLIPTLTAQQKETFEKLKLLGISISSSYELMHEKGFPSLRIGSRLIVPKEKFRAWVEEKTGGSI